MNERDVRNEPTYEPPKVRRVRIDPVKELLTACTATKSDGIDPCVPPQS